MQACLVASRDVWVLEQQCYITLKELIILGPMHLYLLQNVTMVPHSTWNKAMQPSESMLSIRTWIEPAAASDPTAFGDL